MNQKSLSRWLKVIIGGMAVCGTIIYFYLFLVWGKDVVETNPEFSGYYLPWLIVLIISSIPCYWVLYFGWKIATEIGKDNSFSMKNALYLKNISILAALDSVYFFGANVLLMVLNVNHPSIFFISLLIVFAGISVTVAAAVLSHLVRKAADIQKENEFTI